MKKQFLSLLILFVASTAVASGKSVSYKVGGESYEGYFISPVRTAPLVLMIHDWDGLTNYEVKRAKMLADMGYTVFAADLFGAGVRPTKVEDKRQHTGELYKDRDKMRKLLNGALAKAKSMGANTDTAVAMGYCFGGAAVLEFARSGAGMKGYISFHGGLGTPSGQDYTKTTGKLLIMHGTADSHISMTDFSNLAMELEKQGVDHEMITYGQAPHAFTVFGSKRYQEEADKKSWNRFLQFLKEVFENK